MCFLSESTPTQGVCGRCAPTLRKTRAPAFSGHHRKWAGSLTTSPAPSPLPSQKHLLSGPLQDPAQETAGHISSHTSGWLVPTEASRGSQQTRAQNGSSLINFYVRALIASSDTWDTNYSMPLLRHWLMIPRTTNTFLCKQLHLTLRVFYLMHVNHGLVSAAGSLAPPPQSCLQKCIHLKNVLPDPVQSQNSHGSSFYCCLEITWNQLISWKLINYMN